MLTATVVWIIGEQQPENAILKLMPETINHLARNVTKSFLFFPLEYEDVMIRKVIWRKTEVI